MTMAKPAALTPASTSAARRAAATSPFRIGVMATLLGIVVAAVYTAVSLYRFQNMQAGVDLAIFTQAAQRYARWQWPWSDIKGATGFNLLGDHFSPILAALGPVYAVIPHAWVLLIVQAVLIGATTTIVSVFAARALSLRVGVAIGIVFAGAWGVQGLAVFDFHEVAFALPLLAMSYGFLLRRQERTAVLWALPLMLVKEDSVFLILGIALVIASRRRWRLAALTAAYGVVSFALIVGVIIPAISYYGRYTYWSSSAAAGGNFVATAWNALATSVTSGATPILLLVLLLPTLGLAVRSPLLLGIVPVLVSRLTAPHAEYWGLDLHYNGTVTVVIMFAFVDALRLLRAPTLRVVLVSALAVTVALAGVGPAWRVISALSRPCEPADQCASVVIPKVLGHVPDGARVAAADYAAAYLVDRTQVFGLHNYIRDSTGQPIYPEFVVLDRIHDGGWQNAWVNTVGPHQVDYLFLGEALNLTTPNPYDISVFAVRFP